MVYFQKLVYGHIASELFAAAHNHDGKSVADARYSFQQCRIGCVEVYQSLFPELVALIHRELFPERIRRFMFQIAVFRSNVYQREQMIELFAGHTVNPAQVLFLMESSSLGPVFIDIAHLPGREAQSQQLGGVGRIRVECERSLFLDRYGIIGFLSPDFCRLVG